jgi:hypothetical protein
MNGLTLKFAFMKINIKPAFLMLLLFMLSLNIMAQGKRQVNGHEYVDLGLSVKWATCNVGASRPSEFGDYYVWGETSAETLKSDVDAEEQLINSIHPESGYDTARENWGGAWRLPTKEEFQELRDNCYWTWTTQGGQKGARVTSKKNGRSIFLPAEGYRDSFGRHVEDPLSYYWTSTLSEESSEYACSLGFTNREIIMGFFYRHDGFNVRPVID